VIYLLDADMVNYLLKGIAPVPEHYALALLAGAEFGLAGVVHYELKRHLLLKNATRVLARYENLVSKWEHVDVVGPDWDRASFLWAERHRAGKPIEDADLLIAVAAGKIGATLVTNNLRHYQDLGVPLVNWAAGPPSIS
jgi:tRNA(fMet)-specific endonuclease VapC